jgi:hypothetical protein
VTAPPDAAEKLAMPLPRDDGVPARRRLDTIRCAQGYRMERAQRINGRKGQVDAPMEVSMFCMDTRTYWLRVDALTEPNPMMELARSVPEAPPQGSQWTDATSSGPCR